MLENFYPQDFTDPIIGESSILIVKPNKEYDPTQDLKKLVLDAREVIFTYPKQDIDLFAETQASGAKLILQIGKPVTRKLRAFTEMTPELEKEIWNCVHDKFVNYHHHDEYSMRDALGTSKQLSVLLQSQKRKFMSITNHGSVGVWVKQGNVCKETGIKAIYGMEGYYNNYRGEDPEVKKLNRSANHLILLAQTEEGYYNIIQLHNDAQLNGFYYTPRTCDESLQKYGKGIAATSACAAGELARLVMGDQWELAEQRYAFYKSCFDDFYIELQLIEMKEQREINRRLIKLGQKLNAKFTIGIDSHYLYSENSETHDLLMCIRQRRTVNDLAEENDDTWQFSVKNLYYRSFEQLRELFKEGYVTPNFDKIEPYEDELFTEELFYQACMNTRKITVCADDIKLDTSIKLPTLYEDSETVFRNLAWAGFKNFGFDKCLDSQKYTDRLNYELDVICLSGWTDYFLITKMIIDKAIELKGEWSCGFGRGSAAGSLVSYCVGITHIDPIKYDLLFERFLDFSRSEIKVCTFEV